jgi:hypothetical protein
VLDEDLGDNAALLHQCHHQGQRISDLERLLEMERRAGEMLNAEYRKSLSQVDAARAELDRLRVAYDTAFREGAEVSDQVQRRLGAESMRESAAALVERELPTLGVGTAAAIRALPLESET